MQDQDNLELLRSFLSAWDRADVDELMALLAEGCVYQSSLGPEPGKTYSGKEDLKHAFTDMTATETEIESRQGRAWVSGEHGFVEWSYTKLADNGALFEIRGLDVIHILGGKIKSIDAYRKSF